MVLLATIAGIGAGGFLAARAKPDPWAGIWRSDSADNDRVELNLRRSGKFDGSELWRGPTSKPGPAYRMSGTWHSEANSLHLTDIKYEGPYPRSEREMTLDIAGASLTWHFRNRQMYLVRRPATDQQD